MWSCSKKAENKILAFNNITKTSTFYDTLWNIILNYIIKIVYVKSIVIDKIFTLLKKQYFGQLIYLNLSVHLDKWRNNLLIFMKDFDRFVRILDKIALKFKNQCDEMMFFTILPILIWKWGINICSKFL